LVDLFIEEYTNPITQRGEKTMLVRTVAKTVYDNGYRFLKPDSEGIFAELGIKFVLKKVGRPPCSEYADVCAYFTRSLVRYQTVGIILSP
jgi:hypothetical protein